MLQPTLLQFKNVKGHLAACSLVKGTQHNMSSITFSGLNRIYLNLIEAFRTFVYLIEN